MRKALSEEAIRTMHLVALDATNLVRRLEERQHEMISGFSRLRDREALLGAMRCFGLSARFQDLSVLDAPVQDAVVRFYELVDELKWYFQFTTDMPGALQDRFLSHRKRLALAHAELAAALEKATAEPVTAPRARAAKRALPARKR